MRTPNLTLAMALCLGPLAAQDPIDQLDAKLLGEVERRLASDAASDAAWGGYLAGHYRLRRANRPICEALARWQGREGIEARIVRLHLADGLIRIGARVPFEQVASLFDDPLTRAAALGVVANDPHSNREALTSLALAPAEPGDMTRIVAAQLLLAYNLPAPKLGAFVAKGLECQVTMIVRDEHTVDQAVDGAIGLGGMRMDPPDPTRTREGFPPLIRLQLTSSPGVMDTLRMVVPRRSGSDAVYLARTEKVTYSDSQLERGRLSATFSEDELVQLLRGMSRVRIAPRTFLRHSWQGADGCKRAFEEKRDELCRRLDNALQALRTGGWLGKKDLPDFRIKLEERLIDVRGDTSIALPEISKAPAIGH